MQTWVISLPERADRLAAFDARARAAGVTYQVQPGIKPETVPSTWRASRSTYGCREAHLSILRRASDSVLIFEDDALLDEGFAERFARAQELAGDWEVILGGASILELASVWTPPVHQIKSWHRTQCYAVSAPALPHVISAIESATVHWDGRFGAIMGARRHSWLIVPTIGQDAALGSDMRS